MSRPRKPVPEIPGYWKDALPQKTGVRPGIPVPAAGVQSVGKRSRSRNVFVRYLLLTVFFGIIGAIVWLAFDSQSGDASSAASVETGGPYLIDYKTDGFIPESYVREKLDGDVKSSSMPPIFDVKRKLEKITQVREVLVRRLSGDRLSITIFERRPVARLYALLNGEPVPRLVSAEGVVYAPINMGESDSGKSSGKHSESDSMILRNMPILTGAKLTAGADYDYIDGFKPVADFLDLAREKYKKVYEGWLQISLASYTGKADAPGAVFRIKPRLNTQSPDAAALVEILFSPVYYASELDLIGDPNVAATIAATLKSVDRTKYPAYRLDLSMINDSSPRYPVSEPRLIPVPPAATRP